VTAPPKEEAYHMLRRVGITLYHKVLSLNLTHDRKLSYWWATDYSAVGAVTTDSITQSFSKNWV
jgi:hypothetical protein